jgi:hypothetical protein
MDDSFSIDAPF